MPSTSASRGFQLIIAQYGRDHLRTKVRRAGVNTADRRFQLTEYASRGFGVFTHHGQTADALAVEGEDFEKELLTSAGRPALAIARMA